MSTQSTTQYFDLHTTGVGYANRFRKVDVKRGNAFYCVDITALQGASDDVQKVRFDCKIAGEAALKVMKRAENAINEGKKVLMSFKISDLYVESFTYSKGEKKGEQGVSLKARLIHVSWLKVDGEMKYQATKAQAAEATTEAE